MMNDKEFFELQLRATIVPQQVRCPAPQYLHWQTPARRRQRSARAREQSLHTNGRDRRKCGAFPRRQTVSAL
jgi:hypothetical protein